MKFNLSRTDLEALIRELQTGLNRLSHEDNIDALEYKRDWHPIITASAGTFTLTDLALAKYCLNGKGKRTYISLYVKGSLSGTPQSVIIPLPDGVIGKNENELICGVGLNGVSRFEAKAFVRRNDMIAYQTSTANFSAGIIEFQFNGSFERV